ncbi:DUF6624 domain-containing protein [Flavobacterium sp. ACN6]|uniref:DUF6624 domain-containing protein n=1 Tax=Flavobacterium sp. ACN6 TaxID=1920426 RepID=UPI000BB38A9C|nr:DUF6624 domain-containing protein [Flavobacterium sp. ACN6]PBJ13088.1 hypothetical protein BSF42_14870 [Flavobacterium sp. ACN6]
MKKIVAFFFITMNIGLMQCQTYKEFVAKGDDSYNAKDYKGSVEFYEKAFKMEHTSSSDLYNGACAAALNNDDKKAFKWLDLAIDNGYENIAHIKIDTDLESLHNKKEWTKTIEKLQKKMDIMSANYDKPLQKELLDIYTEDQGIRGAFMKIYKEPNADKKKIDSIGKIMQYKDSLNLVKVMKILDEKGWVGKNVVGSQANQTLFLVIQHADLKYQQKYLPMMREAVKKGNASPSNLAYLEDRIALREGKKQIYGSQVSNHPITKKPFVSPLEDPDNVDKRRASVGLGTLSDYLKNFNAAWDVEAYKKELPEFEKLLKEKKQKTN